MAATLESVKFGVELELTGVRRADVARAVWSVVGGTITHVGRPDCHDPYRVDAADGRAWTVVNDSSLISAEPHLRAEVVTPILGYDDIPTLQAVVRAARAAGCHAPEDAGMHVHVSSPDLTPKAVATFCKLVYKQEEIIYAALGVTDARKARYCKPLNAAFIDRICRCPPRTWRALNIAWYGKFVEHPQRYDNSRYCGVNLNGLFLRQAIEIRSAQSTLHAGEVRAVVTFCMALLVRAMNSHGASAKKRVFNPASGRYDMRVLLVSALSLNGERFWAVRKHLLSRIPGDSAFKWGRSQRPRRAADPKVTATTTPDMTPRAEADTLRPSC
jgi:hypothetical protein